MHISQRTIIEASAAIVAVTAYLQLASEHRKLRVLDDRKGRMLVYAADIIKRENTPIDEFDVIAIHTLVDE